MKKTVYIQVDENDGDYLSNECTLGEIEIEAIRKVAKAIASFEPYKTKTNDFEMTHSHNFATGDCLRTDLGEKSPRELYVDTGMCSLEEFEIFDDLVPFGNYGVHTVECVELRPVVESEDLLVV